MPKVYDEPMVRFDGFLYKRDLDRLRLRYGKQPGCSAAVRLIVRKFLNKLDEHLSTEEDLENEETTVANSSDGTDRVTGVCLDRN